MKRRHFRRLVALAVLGALAAYSLVRLPSWSASLLARGLASFFGRSASVARVRFRLVPLQVEVSGVKVAGRTSADPPFLEFRMLVVYG